MLKIDWESFKAVALKLLYRHVWFVGRGMFWGLSWPINWRCLLVLFSDIKWVNEISIFVLLQHVNLLISWIISEPYIYVCSIGDMFCFYTNIKVIMKKVKAYWNRENAKSTEFECLGAEMIYRCSSFSHATTKCLERYESWESFHVTLNITNFKMAVPRNFIFAYRHVWFVGRGMFWGLSWPINWRCLLVLFSDIKWVNEISIFVLGVVPREWHVLLFILWRTCNQSTSHLFRVRLVRGHHFTKWMLHT
jgi:hypothetical protein